MSLSQKDQAALEWLKRHKSEVLISEIPDRDAFDVLGEWTPGMARFKRLAKLDLVYITEEEPIILDGGELLQLTPSLCLV